MLAIHVICLVVSWTYTALAQQVGIDIANDVTLGYQELADAVTDLNVDAAFVQSVINGTQPVGGEFIADVFLAPVPEILGNTQVCSPAAEQLCTGGSAGESGGSTDPAASSALAERCLRAGAGH